MKDTQLVSVSVFYKNDTPNGFGTTIPANVYYALQAETNAVWEGFRSECGDNDDCIAGILIEQLEQYGANKHTLTQHLRLLVVMNIIMLAERGYIKQNEFNGTQFCYTNRDANKIADALFK